MSSEPTVVQHNLSIFGTPYIRAMLVSDIDSRSHALSTHLSLYLCITSSYYDPSRQWIVGLHSSLKVPQPKPQAPPNSQRRVPDIVKSLDTEIHALRIFRQANLAFCRSFTVSLSTFLTLAASFTVSILSPASSGANGHRQEPNNCRRAIATAPPLDAAAACRLPLAACRCRIPWWWSSSGIIVALFPTLATSPNCRLKKLTQISTRIKDAAVAISLPEKMLCAVSAPSPPRHCAYYH